MRFSNSNSAILFFLLFITIIITSFKLSHCSGKSNNGRISCPETEKQALLKFKDSVNDTSNVLSSWNNDPRADCCTWERVVCSNSTGHVLELHLQNNDFDQYISGLQGTELNPSLLNLTQLRYLDLSWNSFNGTIPTFIWSFEYLQSLNLSSAGFHGFPTSGVGGTLNISSSINVKHLKYLDLSWNQGFEQSLMPEFIGSFTSLEYLDLSEMSFSGSIPTSIGNLTNLHTLNLNDNWMWSADSLEWLHALSRLEYLNMNSVDLSRAVDWARVINSMPCLVELHLRDCSLNFSTANHVTNISTSLAVLDLSRNYNTFQIEYYYPSQTTSNSVILSQDRSIIVPGWIFQLNTLVFLDLSDNLFEGPFPVTGNITALQHIDLSRNNFNSPIPDWLYSCNHLESMTFSFSYLNGLISNAIGNLSSLHTLDLSYNDLSGDIPREIAKLCSLHSLDLSWNKLQGELSRAFGSISDCFGRDLEFLYLSYNQLSGHLIDRIGEFSHLTIIALGKNSLSGAIPSNLGNLRYLSELNLENNQFTGNLPESFGNLINLESVSLENNKLEGVVTENHFANLTNLSFFSASGNHLTLKVSPNWIPPFKLRHLGMGSWSLGAGTVVPTWLETQKDELEVLDLSNTGISFPIPNWLWEIPRLNLSHNKLHGTIPDINGDTKHGLDRAIFVSFNLFNGSLPQVAAKVEALDLSNNYFSGGLSRLLCDMTEKAAYFLLLGANLLSGKIPDCWMKWPLLELLNLENNNLSSQIPNSIGLLRNLQYLDLKNNSLSGPIPSSMQNCTSLAKIDLSHNMFTGKIPQWIGTRTIMLKILILRANKLNGEIPSTICNLNSLRILDLSGNNLSGIIFRCVNNFSAMATKESSRGIEAYRYNGTISSSEYYLESASISTKGSELQYDTNLGLVTSIDLSQNNLSGDIPVQLTRLVELRFINLSGNQFMGRIPDGIGNMKQMESLDLSRNFLSGNIPNTLAALTSLNYLNLSYNNLTGPIPQSTQLLGFQASSFIGNRLCGLPLTSNCGNNADIPATGHGNHKQKDGGSESNIDWFYVFLSLGYAVGFSVVCSIFVLKRSWRDACFGFLEDMWNKFYVFLKIRLGN